MPELIFPATHFANSVAISPDGKWVISVQGNEVKIWENESTRLIKNIKFSKNVNGPVNETGVLAISPNSQIVALQNADSLYFFNLDKFDFDKKVKLAQPIHEMVFTADSKTLYCGGHNSEKYEDYFILKINIADVSTSTIQKYAFKTPASHEINHMSISPDGNTLLVYDAVMGSRLIDLKSNKIIKTFEKEVFPYTFLTNGNMIGYSGEKEKAFFVEELDGKTYKSLRKSDKIFEDLNDVSAQNYAVSYPSVSSRLVIEYQGEFVIFDTKTFEFSSKNTFPNPELGMNNAMNIALSSDGSYYMHGLTMRRLRTFDNTVLKKYGLFPVMPDVHFPLQHTNGVWMRDRVLYFDENAFRMKRFNAPDKDQSVTFRLTQDGKKGFMINNSKGLIQFDPNVKKLVAQEITSIPTENLLGMRLFESLGLMTVVASDNVYILDLKTMKLRNQVKKPENGGSHALLERGLNYYSDISPDKTKLIWHSGSSENDEYVHCFDLATKRLMWTYKAPWISNIRFSDNGKKVQLTALYKLIELDVTNGTPTGNETTVSTSKWEWWSYLSPSSKVAATQMPNAADDGVGADIQLFDVVSKKYMGILKGPEYRTEGLHFLRNERYLVAEEYGGLRIWDTEKKREIAKILMFDDSDDWIISTPDGRFDASPDAMKKMYFTKGKEVIPLESLYEQFYVPNLLSLVWEDNLPPKNLPDIKKLKSPPSVKISFNNGTGRNLEVADDDKIQTFNSDKSDIQLTLKANKNGDDISEIRLYQNNKLVYVNGKAGAVIDASSLNLNINLLAGDNIFKAIAINSQRTESKADQIIVKYAAPKAVKKDVITLHLVVIGINVYKNPKYSLNYALADATSFKEAISKSCGKLMTECKEHFITDASATKVNIIAELDKITAEAQPQDVLILYYAGHGVVAEGSKEFYLVPHDVTQLYGNDDALAQKGLSANDLRQYSQKIKAQKQLFILDACQSSGALQAVAMRGAAEEKAIAQLARATGTHWLTAAGSEQFASEFSQLGHGVFTYALLNALNGAADNGDGRVTVKELDAYLQEQVPELTQKYKGTPQYPASYGFGNDFPIGVAKQ